MRDAASPHLMMGEHSFLIDESLGDLDLDLVKSLVALSADEQAGDETTRSTSPILIAAAGWFIAGVVLWALVGFYL